MFTGIIESLGVIKKLRKSQKSMQISIEVQNVDILDDVKIGDSVATNGVCLTVTHLNGNVFEANVMNETVNVTSLHSLKVDGSVNLERALKVSDRLGGHIVSGHVDGIGTVSNIQKNDIAYIFTIKAGDELLRYMIKRGSITIDGISLTIIEVTDRDFSVSIIPHTAQQTTFLNKRVGDIVNLETDILAKYVDRLLGSKKTTNITEEFLKENGF